jgi:valyl-tRNA synthetase
VDILAGKLSNEGFVAKAPPAVVEVERAKLAEQREQLGRLQVQMGQLAAL